MADPKLCLNWNNFQENMRSAFQDLRWDPDLADVTLACEDQSIKAHQVVLSSCSPIFKKLLKAHSHPHPLIYMRGVKLNNLLALMDYIYLGSADISQDHIEEFLLLAEELQLKGLSERDFGEIFSGSNGTDTPLEQDEFISNPEEPKQEVSIQGFHETVIKYGNPMTACNQDKFLNTDTDALFKNDISKKTFKEEKQVKKDIIKREKQAKRKYAGNIDANVEQDMLGRPNNEQKQGKNISNDILEQINLMIEKQQKNFSCKVCGYNSRNKGHANEHVEKHIEGLEYPCDICSKILRYFIFHRIHPRGDHQTNLLILLSGLLLDKRVFCGIVKVFFGSPKHKFLSQEQLCTPVP